MLNIGFGYEYSFGVKLWLEKVFCCGVFFTTEVAKASQRLTELGVDFV